MASSSVPRGALMIVARIHGAQCECERESLCVSMRAARCRRALQQQQRADRLAYEMERER